MKDKYNYSKATYLIKLKTYKPYIYTKVVKGQIKIVTAKPSKNKLGKLNKINVIITSIKYDDFVQGIDTAEHNFREVFVW